jgi:hypothetical protein
MFISLCSMLYFSAVKNKYQSKSNFIKFESPMLCLRTIGPLAVH